MDSVADQKRQLYNRQEYVVGAETQAKYGSTDVLVVGVSGLGAEIVKNLTLTGVRSIKILDDSLVQLSDLSSNFFLQDSDVGKRRGAVVAAAAEELNRFVEVKAVSGNVGDLLPAVGVAIFVDQPTTTLVKENELARKHKVKFVCCESHGITASIFVDAGDSFEIVDSNGEETVSCVVTSVGKGGLVTLHDDKSHECTVGDQIYFTGLASPATANTILDATSTAVSPAQLKLFEVEDVVTPYILQLKNFAQIAGIAEERGGSAVEVGTSAYMHTTKRRSTVSFRSLAESVGSPEFVTLFDNEGKSDAPTTLHAVSRVIHQFGKCPTTEAEVAEIVTMARAFVGNDLDEGLARLVLSVYGGDLNPMACFVGGMAAQEALKVCSGKFTPIRQWLYYDAREVLQARGGTPEEWLASGVAALRKDDRYCRQRAVLGGAFQTYLSQQRAFIVGAGALGCELIKNAALMGLGGVSITDMDHIEMSNLSRQFLFRDRHIGKPKSTVAAGAAQRINKDLSIIAYESKVAPETEGLFNEHFWANHQVVLNALDNVVSRKYVDERCLFYKRPLFESGTLGTKCNMQPVIPYVTESYSSSYDPPEKSIPLCTLKNFPSAIEHTIQWARDQFELLFTSTAADVNAYLDNPEAFATQIARDPAASVLAIKHVSEALRAWPQSPEDCLQAAFALFHQSFNENLKQLLHNIPLDKRNEDGQLFWSGAKKPPTPLTYNAADEQQIGFVYHTACLLAEVYGLPPLHFTKAEVASMTSALRAPEFVPRQVVFATSEKDTSDTSAAQAAGDMTISDLPPAAQFAAKRMRVQEFEKDDLTNHHVDFVTHCSNLRAIAYGIPPADLTRTKRIAGKIIPAMVTTTSLVTGLVGFEMLKYLLLQYRHAAAHTAVVSGSPAFLPSPEEAVALLSLYRSAFVNIALPFIAFSEPIIAAGRTYALPSGRTLRWTSWERIDIDEGAEITVNALVKLLEERYELEVFMITLSSGRMIFTQFGGKKADREKLISVVAQEKGESMQEGEDYLNLIATGMIGEEDDVDVPMIRYKYRNY